MGENSLVMGFNSVMVDWMENLNQVLYEANEHEMMSYRDI